MTSVGSPIGDTTPESTYSREVLIELVSLHARILRRMPWVQTVLAVGVGLFVLRYVPFAAFVTWCVLSLGVESLRARYASGVLRRSADIDPKRVHRTFILWALAAGTMIGIGAAFCFPRLPIPDQAALGIVLFATPAAGVAVSQSSRYIAAAYSLSILVPATVSWMLLYPHQALGVGALTTLYCGFIIFVAVEGEQLLLRSVMIRHERDRLVRDLEQRNADVRVAMERAEQAAQSRARVLATASHDLRQPLHALSIYSAVLAAGPEPEQLREVSANIDQIVRSLGSLLHGLLDLSRLTVGHYEPDYKCIELDAVVGAVCAEYQRTASDKHLVLRSVLVPIRLLGDGVAIGRILRNLLDNAIKYTEHGTVNVSTHIQGDNDAATAIVSVSDSGPGIPAAEQGRIFEEFYQLDNPERDRNKGVGLGLAIVKRLCELIGAEILLESTPGNGTRFLVRLRGVLVDSVPASMHIHPDESIGLQGRSVYLIDDESDILHSTQQLLVKWGMRVATAGSVDAAELLFQRAGKPDLLITDLRLRGPETGAELAARLRQAFTWFPVLVITGEISAAAIRKVDHLGAALLYKPIAAEALRRAISQAISASVG